MKRLFYLLTLLTFVTACSEDEWTDEFYQRTKLELAYGADEYKDIDDLGIKQILGWQSDVELVEKSLPYFINDDKFFAFLITSSMHFPYDTSSALGDKYINEINQYYPNYSMDVKRYISKSMEFDKALETLLTRLEEAGKLDNTVISIFADHRPLKFNQATFISCSQLRDRTGIHGIDLTPFFIYNSGTKGKEITSLCSTVDHLPTIANLFNLNYDPRLYMGHDAFGEDCIVVFNDLNWISKKGTYSNGKASEGLDEEYDAIVVKPILEIGDVLKKYVEKAGLVALVGGMELFSVRASKQVRALQNGNVGFYILVVIIGVTAGIGIFFIDYFIK